MNKSIDAKIKVKKRGQMGDGGRSFGYEEGFE